MAAAPRGKHRHVGHENIAEAEGFTDQNDFEFDRGTIDSAGGIENRRRWS